MKGFERAENLKTESVELFSSKNILNGFSENQAEVYKKFYNYEAIKALLNDEELIKTAILFFENSLNISTASKVGFMHRNTLIYRLDKIKKIIGLDIRNYSDAVVFDNLRLVYNMLNKK